jgi:tetratricopeptide (TPR) repeat protein
MKKNLSIIIRISFIVASVLIFSGQITYGQSHRDLTKNSEKAYESQKFDDAVFYAIDALMKEPEFEKAIGALQMALPAAIRNNENKIKQLKESSSSFYGDVTVDECQEIVNRYSTLIKMNDNLMNLPPIKTKKGGPVTFEIKDYNSDIRQAKDELAKNKELAAEKHYQSGIDLLQLNELEKSKQAAKEFKKAMSFVPDYKDANDKYDQAKKLGIKRIAIIPFENKSGKEHYGAVGEIMTDKIIADLLNDKDAMEFLEIISRDQLEQVIREQNLGSSGFIDEKSAIQVGNVLGVHELLVGQINQIISNETPVTEKTYTQKKEIWSRDGSYFVYANVIEYKKEATASISGSYKIIDAKTAKVIKGDSFKENYSFLSRWAQYTGDEKALGPEVPRTAEQTPPIDEDRVNIVNNKLAVKMVGTIKSYVQ